MAPSTFRLLTGFGPIEMIRREFRESPAGLDTHANLQGPLALGRTNAVGPPYLATVTLDLDRQMLPSLKCVGVAQVFGYVECDAHGIACFLVLGGYVK